MSYTSKLTPELEGLIDRWRTASDTPESVIVSVLSSLATICAEKSDHVRSNWQDEHLARRWENLSSPLDSLAYKLAGKA